jgi:hypothetical protein
MIKLSNIPLIALYFTFATTVSYTKLLQSIRSITTKEKERSSVNWAVNI